MKKPTRSKGTKNTKPAVRSLKGVRSVDAKKAGQVKGGRMWTKGGGAAVG